MNCFLGSVVELVAKHGLMLELGEAGACQLAYSVNRYYGAGRHHTIQVNIEMNLTASGELSIGCASEF